MIGLLDYSAEVLSLDHQCKLWINKLAMDCTIDSAYDDIILCRAPSRIKKHWRQSPKGSQKNLPIPSDFSIQNLPYFISLHLPSSPMLRLYIYISTIVGISIRTFPMPFPINFSHPFVPGGHPLPLHEALRGPRGTPRSAAAAALRPGGGLSGAGDDHQAWRERLGKPWENHGKMPKSWKTCGEKPQIMETRGGKNHENPNLADHFCVMNSVGVLSYPSLFHKLMENEGRSWLFSIDGQLNWPNIEWQLREVWA